MPKFEYRALDSQGNEVSGTLEAASESEAIAQLQKKNYYAPRVGAPGKKFGKTKGRSAGGRKLGRSAIGKKGGGKVKSKALALFTRQLATLIDAGLPLVRGLSVLARQESNPVLKQTINNLSDSVQSGGTFSESLAQNPRIFNKLYVNMVRAGELGGVMELVLTRLAEYQEKAQKLKNKIVTAMIYPVVVMTIALGILVFLLLYIVPTFTKIFEDLGRAPEDLPAVTRFVTGLSGFVGSNIILIGIAVIGVVVGFKFMGQTKGGRMAIDKFKLKVPIIGRILLQSSIARFSRTLGTLVTSGVPILQALNITKETAGNVVVSDAIAKIHDAVKEGESIVQPMESSKVFPAMVISMVDIGEETGQLPDMLLKIADLYDDEVDNSISAMVSMIEPIMIVVLAGIVLVIVLAIFLPMLSIIDEIGS